MWMLLCSLYTSKPYNRWYSEYIYIYNFITIAWFRYIFICCGGNTTNTWNHYQITHCANKTNETVTITTTTTQIAIEIKGRKKKTEKWKAHHHRLQQLQKRNVSSYLFSSGVWDFIFRDLIRFSLFERTDFCHKHKLENSHSRYRTSKHCLKLATSKHIDPNILYV